MRSPSPPTATEPKSWASEAPVLLFGQRSPAPQRHLNALAEAIAAATEPEPLERAHPAQPPGAADLLLSTRAPSTPPHPCAQKLSQEAVYAERPPPQKLGANWTESQWLAKALELADTFASLGHGTGAPDPDLAPPRSPRAVPPAPFCDTKVLMRDGKEVSLVEKLRNEELQGLPDWFTPLDRIYEVCDMGVFHVDAEPMAAERGVAGAPGYSYIVPRSTSKPRRPRGHFVGTGGGASPATMRDEQAEAGFMSSEALLRRYQNRILQTTLPTAGEGPSLPRPR